MNPPNSKPTLSLQPTQIPQLSKPSLIRYKIGLVVVGLFVVGLLVVVLSQAGGAKQDAKTDKAANDISTKLDDYISSKQAIPETLTAANIKDVPSTISYKKMSTESYKFCVTYRSASSGFDANTVVDDVVSRGLYGGTGSSLGAGGLSDTTANSSVGADSSYLYIPYTHKKGENCQTITPAIYPAIDPTGAGASGSVGSQYSADPKKQAEALGNESSACYLSGYATHYSGVVTSTTTAGGKPAELTDKQDLILKVKPNGALPTGEQTITVPSSTYNVYNSACTATSHSLMITGDNIVIFQNSSNKAMLDTIINFYQ